MVEIGEAGVVPEIGRSLVLEPEMIQFLYTVFGQAEVREFNAIVLDCLKGFCVPLGLLTIASIVFIKLIHKQGMGYGYVDYLDGI